MADLVEQLRQLSQLHASGSLSDAEFEAAKSKLLNGDTAPRTDSTSLLALQNELADLDRRWMLEREEFKLTSRYGSWVPKEHDGSNFTLGVSGSGLAGALAFLLIGASKIGLNKAPFVFWIMPLSCLWIVWIGISTGQQMTEKFEAHEGAQAKYKAKRDELEARIRALS